jgi:hypothetical protein
VFSAEIGYKVQTDTLRTLEPWVECVEQDGAHGKRLAWRIAEEHLDAAQERLRELVALVHPRPAETDLQQITLALDALKLARRLEQSNIRLTELAISCGASADEIADARKGL